MKVKIGDVIKTKYDPVHLYRVVSVEYISYGRIDVVDATEVNWRSRSIGVGIPVEWVQEIIESEEG